MATRADTAWTWIGGGDVAEVRRVDRGMALPRESLGGPPVAIDDREGRAHREAVVRGRASHGRAVDRLGQGRVGLGDLIAHDVCGS